MKFREFKRPRDPTCPVCGDGKTPEHIELIDYHPVLQRQELASCPPRDLPSRTAPEARRATRRETSRSASTASVTAISTSPSGWRRWMRSFRAALAAGDAALAARFTAYREGGTLTPPEESALLIEVARPLGAFVARLFGVEPARQAQLDTAAREAAIFRMKHFVVRRASKKYPEDKLPGDDPAALRDRVRKFAADSFPELVAPGDDELTFATVLDALIAREKANPAARRRHRPVRALGGGAPLRAGGARRRRGLGVVPLSALRRPRGPGAAAPARREAAGDHRGAARAPAAARRLRADRPAHVAARGRERGRLLPLLPRAREGFVLDRACTTRRAAVKRNPLGVKIAGCPLDEKIGEMHVLRQGRRLDRGAGDDHRRQPDAARHRPPHLQRLHEGVRVPEAGAGQHPAGGDRRADRRARDALGLRDLRPAHALEPAQPHRVPSRGRTSARTCWSSGWGRPASRCRTTCSTPASASSASTA